MVLKIGSAFSGIGLFDMGFAELGEVAWQIEIDSKAFALLERRFPDAKRFKDVRECGAHNLAPVDVVIGGFPCQDFSVAGKRAGLTGARSGLFFELARIVYELQPTYLIWENVPGLLSSCSCKRCSRKCEQCGEIAGADDKTCDICGGTKFRGRVLQHHRGADQFAVVSTLGKIGFDGAWRVLDSQHFGVPQRRRRVFGVFTNRYSGNVGGLGFAPSGADVSELAGLYQRVLLERERLPGDSRPISKTRQVAACLPASGAGTSRTGNARTESDLIIPYRMQSFGEYTEGGQAGAIKARDAKDATDLVVFDTTQITSKINRSNPQAGDPCHTLARGAHPPTIAYTDRIDRWVDEEDRVRAIQTGAKSSTAQEHVYIKAHGRTDALTATRPPQVIGEAYGVRRLTPVECERLQGCPDDYTDGQSNAARYHQLGNALTVNVARWIARRLAAVIAEAQQTKAA